ncbi:hypothetical protein ACROYT_G032598 [Oculina patagonica]
MITSLPRLKEPRGSTAGEILPRLASDRRKKIPQVGKVFPKTLVQEQVDEKLDFHCVGLEKDKNVLFPNVEVEGAPSSPGTEGRVLTPSLEPGDVTEVTLPELPSVLGSRRGSSLSSPDTPEPPDLLVKGESQKKSHTQLDLDTSEPTPERAPEEVMRSNLEPLIDKLFEEDELFAQDFEEDGLDRVLFIRKMGIYVEIKTKEYVPGVVCTPLFHCPRCKDHWMQYGTVPENCPYKRQPCRGPAIHLASKRKRRVDRKRKTKRSLGDIKEGFIVSGSGTVLDQIDEDGFEDSRVRTSSLRDAPSRDYLTSDDVVLEDLSLGVIDSRTKIEAFKVLHIEGEMTDEEYVRKVADALGFNEEQYNKFARVNINMEIKMNDAGLGGKTSVISRLDLSMLDSMTVKDLPEKIRVKLLSILRLQRQRKRRQKQALANKKKATTRHGADSQQRAVKTNKKRRDTQGKEGKLHGSGGSKEDISDQETPGGRSASGRSASRVSSSFISDSDDGEFSASRSPSDVLAYKELQSRRRSRQKNAAVKNRSGQPDTPFQRLGRHPRSMPSNSSSFFSYENGDSDEEIWGRGRGSSVGSSRAHRSDSYTSYMSDMARGGHVTDSRTSMAGNYSRTMGSARARKDVSFSNLDDQMSYGSLGNDESIYDLEDDPSGPSSNRARRQSKKKEKGDGAKRPGRYYHSKVIDDMGQVTASFGDTNTMYGSKARLSQARISLIDANIPSQCDSTFVIKRSSRPASVKEPSQKKKETVETECLPEPSQEKQEDLQNCSESLDELPPLEDTVTQISGTASPTQAREKQSSPELSPEEKPKKLFKRTFQEKRKPLVSFEDLNVIHRLPVSSAFTFSFYELPNQHREQNESIKKAAGRIGRRKKKESGHFRSKSAP